MKKKPQKSPIDQLDKFEFAIIGELKRYYHISIPFQIFSKDEFKIIAEFYDEDFQYLMLALDDTKGFELKCLVREYIIETEFKFHQAEKEKQIEFFPLHKRMQMHLFSILDSGGKVNEKNKITTISKFRELFHDTFKYKTVIGLLINYNYIISDHKLNNFKWKDRTRKQGAKIIDLLEYLLEKNLIKREFYKPEIISNIFSNDFQIKISSKTFQREISARKNTSLKNRSSSFAFLLL
jgi:hypothetical protein